MNKQLFLIIIPVVLICSLKLALQQSGTNLMRSSIDETLLQSGVPVKTRRAVFHALILFTSLLMVLNTKVTSLFKVAADYRCKVDVATLLIMAVLLVNLSITMVQHIQSVWRLGQADSHEKTSCHSVYDDIVDQAAATFSSDHHGPVVTGSSFATHAVHQHPYIRELNASTRVSYSG